MLYHADDMLLEPVGEFLRGKVNNGYLCRDVKSVAGAVYILLLIHDRSCVKRMLELFQQMENTGKESPYLLCFTQNEQLGLVFRYQGERELFSFAPGQMVNTAVREEICTNLVMECITSPLPPPMLYLVLTQDCVHLEKDNTVYLLPKLDLTELSPQLTEADCATQCAQMVLRLLQVAQSSRNKGQLRSYELIRKKLDRRKYLGFPELYQDIRVTAIPLEKQGIRARITSFWSLYKDRIFNIILVICMVVVALSLVFAVCQMIFGDIPLLRFFERAFEVIGTETLS